MSGGRWNYADGKLGYAVEDIQHIIDTNDDDTLNEWGQPTGRHYPPDVLKRYREAITVMRLAQIYWHRIDWLESGDDGDDTFLSRLADDLQEAGLGGVEISDTGPYTGITRAMFQEVKFQEMPNGESATTGNSSFTVVRAPFLVKAENGRFFLVTV